MNQDAMKRVCAEVQEIMQTYREQYPNIDTPGGLEHMGDVWSLLRKWDTLLSTEADKEEK